MRSRLYLIAAVFAIVAAVAHLVAVKYTLYWSLSWFDFPVHTAASVMLGIVCYLVASWVFSYRVSFTVAFLLLAVAGLSWELFEYLVGTSYVQLGFYTDTIEDLIADLLGGGIGILLSHRMLKPVSAAYTQ